MPGELAAACLGPAGRAVTSELPVRLWRKDQGTFLDPGPGARVVTTEE